MRRRISCARMPSGESSKGGPSSNGTILLGKSSSTPPKRVLGAQPGLLSPRFLRLLLRRESRQLCATFRPEQLQQRTVAVGRALKHSAQRAAKKLPKRRLQRAGRIRPSPKREKAKRASPEPFP